MAANVSVSGGYLTLTAKKQSQSGFSFTSGAVKTGTKFTQAYGRWEFGAMLRRRVDAGQGAARRAAPGCASGNQEDPEMIAADIMTADVVTVTPETPVPEIARLLVDRRISAVPVVVDGRPVGMVSEGDLLRQVAQLRGQANEKLSLAMITLAGARDTQADASSF